MTTIDNISNDIRAYIYQNTNDLEQKLIPDSKLSVALVETAKDNTFTVKFTLTAPQFTIDAVGTSNNPFDAVKEAKEKMSTFLSDVKSQLRDFETATSPKVLH
ncbi:MAG: hypothetical protein KDD37_02340 [Bdellovibrionales bacterium]|nr:hypothetical protein [Bdellovibrionales bacterium]